MYACKYIDRILHVSCVFRKKRGISLFPGTNISRVTIIVNFSPEILDNIFNLKKY